MTLAELERKVQDLSPEDLRAFTKWFASYAAELADEVAEERAVHESVARMENIIKGRTAGLTESQFRQALG